MTWTFSDTVIVAIIGGITTVAAATIPVLLAKRKEAATTAPADDAPSPVPSKPSPVNSQAESPKSSSSRELLPISTFSIAEMQERLRSVPPFQKASIEQHYKGLRVRWRAKLDAVHPDTALPSVYAHAEADYLDFCCRSTSAGIASLLHTPKNASILIDGIIESASEAYCRLTDCVIVPDDPSNALREQILTQAASAMEDAPVMQLAVEGDYTEKEIALQIQLLIDEGLIKGRILASSPLTFFITQLTSIGRSRLPHVSVKKN